MCRWNGKSIEVGINYRNKPRRCVYVITEEAKNNAKFITNPATNFSVKLTK